MPYGGFHIHDAGTKKLMLMQVHTFDTMPFPFEVHLALNRPQAAKQMLFFWLPRKESEPAYTMAEVH